MKNSVLVDRFEFNLNRTHSFSDQIDIQLIAKSLDADKQPLSIISDELVFRVFEGHTFFSMFVEYPELLTEIL